MTVLEASTTAVAAAQRGTDVPRLDKWHISPRALSKQVEDEAAMWPRVFVDESLDVHKWGIELGTGVIKLTHRVIGPEEFTGDELPTLRHSERPYKKPPPKPLSAEELEQYEDAEEQLKKLLHGEIETWEVERGVLRRKSCNYFGIML